MIAPLRCCAVHAEKIGKPPSMAVRCPPCSDYHGYLEHVYSLMTEPPGLTEPAMSYKAQMAAKKG